MLIAIPELGKLQPNYPKALDAMGIPFRQIGMDFDVDEFDGLVLTGGADIHPRYYGEEINGSKDINEELDDLQFHVLERFVQARKPILGICRGHQVLTVAFGGKLIQHLPSSDRHARIGDSEEKYHTVFAEPGTVIDRLYGREFIVNSSHHQAAAEVPSDFILTAMSDDGVIEGFAHKTLPIISVQWHPERMAFSFYDERRSDGGIIWKHWIGLCGGKPADETAGRQH